MARSLPLAFAVAPFLLSTFALDNGLARLPPMGWRSWEAFYGDIDEAKMLATMDVLVDRSRGIDSTGAACTVGLPDCVPTSLADVGFADVGLDAGFEDCNSRQVGGMPAFHDVNGNPMIDKTKFPSGLAAMVNFGHQRNLTVSWYGSACACKSENSYSDKTQPTIAQAIAGTVAATVAYGFDGLKLDSCSQFNNMTRWADEINATGKRVLLENCHQGGLVPGQLIPGQECDGLRDSSTCPYHVYRTSDDIYNHWENVVNNINSVTPYLTQADPKIVPRSRPGAWAYPDMLESGNLGCKTGSSCNQTTQPLEDRSQFGMWAIVSSPLVLSVDLRNGQMLDRIWPILSNKEAIAVNQHWSGSPGQLLLTDGTSYPSPLNSKGYYEYPATLGQARGWQNVPGMTGPPSWQVGPCVDEWTGGACTHHYMTLGGGPMNMTVPAADDWCNANSSCLGFTFLTQDKDQETQIYFRDETQIFFMDSEIDDLASPVGKSKYTSHIKQHRAPPISPTTSGVQVWVKDVSGPDNVALALLLVNLGQAPLTKYSLPLGKLPPQFHNEGKHVRVRDIWNHGWLADLIPRSGSLTFENVLPHDSVFYVLHPQGEILVI